VQNVNLYRRGGGRGPARGHLPKKKPREVKPVQTADGNETSWYNRIGPERNGGSGLGGEGKRKKSSSDTRRIRWETGSTAERSVTLIGKKKKKKKSRVGEAKETGSSRHHREKA